MLLLPAPTLPLPFLFFFTWFYMWVIRLIPSTAFLTLLTCSTLIDLCSPQYKTQTPHGTLSPSCTVWLNPASLPCGPLLHLPQTFKLPALSLHVHKCSAPMTLSPWFLASHFYLFTFCLFLTFKAKILLPALLGLSCRQPFSLISYDNLSASLLQQLSLCTLYYRYLCSYLIFLTRRAVSWSQRISVPYLYSSRYLAHSGFSTKVCSVNK